MQILEVVQLKIENLHQNCKKYIQEIFSAQENYEHLSKLELADFANVSSELPVDLLVGVDYYFCFFNKQCNKKSYEPVACETILGWVLSGPLSSEHSFSSCLTAHSMR